MLSEFPFAQAIQANRRSIASPDVDPHKSIQAEFDKLSHVLASQSERVLRTRGQLIPLRELASPVPRDQAKIAEHPRSRSLLRLMSPEIDYDQGGETYKIGMCQEPYYSLGLGRGDIRNGGILIYGVDQTGSSEVETFPIFKISKYQTSSGPQGQNLDNVRLNAYGQLDATNKVWTQDPVQVQAALEYVEHLDTSPMAFVPERPEDIVIPENIFNELPYQK